MASICYKEVPCSRRELDGENSCVFELGCGIVNAIFNVRGIALWQKPKNQY